jgi:hypothetical protein
MKEADPQWETRMRMHAPANYRLTYFLNHCKHASPIENLAITEV